MSILSLLAHNAAIAVGRRVGSLLPERVPMTFVGTRAIPELCRSISQTGVQRILVVTDRGLVELGMADRVTAALRDAGVEVCVYDGAEPDPTFAQCEAGAQKITTHRCDAVLALGGGSPMDAAKVIAALATNHKRIDSLVGMFKLRQAPLPLFAIPTTAGTGSEATMVAVATDPTARAKKFFIDPKLIPSMTALDASLMTGLPPAITAATGMDALTHAVESFIGVATTPMSERFATSAVRMVFHHLPAAYADGSNLDARSAMALASYSAGIAFNRTSLGYVHAVSHQLGAYYKTPHGLANAIVLPHVLEFSKGPAAARLAQLADVLGLGGRTATAKAEGFIEAVRAMSAELGIPAALEALQPADIPAIATRAMAEAFGLYPVPRYMTQSQCEALLHGLLAT